MVPTTHGTEKIAASLASNTCACGAGKPPGRSFCRMCSYDLHPRLRGQLTKRNMGEGYEEAHRAALAKLVELKRVTPDEAARSGL